MVVIRGTRLLLVVVGIVLFLALCSQFKGLSCGGLFLPCRPLVVCIWVLIIQTLFVLLVVWMVIWVLSPFRLFQMGIFSVLFIVCCCYVDWIRCHLHCFFVAIARAVVGGGGTAPNPLVWFAGSLPKWRGVVDAVRNFAFLPGPVDLEWVYFGVSGITVEDVRVWPYSVSLLVFCLIAADDLGVGGVSFVEMLILHELWAGERLSLEKAVLRHRRVGRPISVSAVPFGPGIDIWRSCRNFKGFFFVFFLCCLVVLQVSSWGYWGFS